MEPWPFAPRTREEHEAAIFEHRARERYAFLAVARAAQERLHLSYAKADGERILRPSLFLLHAAESLGRDLDERASPPATARAPPDRPARDLGRVVPARMSIHEVAHFALCPYRFFLERLPSEMGRYKSRFQLRIAAKGVWLDLVLREAAGHPDAPEPSRRLALLRDAAAGMFPEVRDLFPGFRPLDWAQVRAELEKTLAYYAESLPWYPPSLEEAHSLRVMVHDQAPLLVEFPEVPRAGSWRLSEALLHQEWLLPPDDWTLHAPAPQPEGSLGFAEKGPAAAWWGAAVRWGGLRGRAEPPAFRELLEDATSGRYPKRPGAHCKLCPAYSDCLGR